MPVKTVFIGSDHGGFNLKNVLIPRLKSVFSGWAFEDLGCDGSASVHYPNFAAKVAEQVSAGKGEGLLFCGSGIGVAMAANKFSGVRAATVWDVTSARLCRQHNNANILCLGERLVGPETAFQCCQAWFEAEFEGGRHQERIDLIAALEKRGGCMKAIQETDPKVYEAIQKELHRQRETLELIPSENSTSIAVMQAQGTVLTNKYAEGYPAKRYYGGCEFVDDIEQLAIDRARELFGSAHANVQPHSGSQANMGVYLAALKPGDTILGMDLSHGGHLTHGFKVNFSGMIFNGVAYGVRQSDQRVDFDQVRELARTHRPRMIVAGASAYPRVLDFSVFAEIAKEVDALLMVDMAHIAGLVAAGVHPSPVPHAQFVTSTTHKTLRGPRAGFILCGEEWKKKVDSRIFPGIQGGPLMHVIAAKAIAFREAQQPAFQQYQKQVVENCRALGESLLAGGANLVSGGTDNHLLLVDLRNLGLTGKEAEARLDEVGLTVNKNTVPFETESAFVTSGIRLGTPSITTRGMGVSEMERLGALILQVLKGKSQSEWASVRQEVRELCQQFPLYETL